MIMDYGKIFHTDTKTWESWASQTYSPQYENHKKQ